MRISDQEIDQLPYCLRVEEAAKILGCSRNTAFKLTKQAGFPAIRVGEKRIAIPKDRLLEWIAKQAEGKIE